MCPTLALTPPSAGLQVARSLPYAPASHIFITLASHTPLHPSRRQSHRTPRPLHAFALAPPRPTLTSTPAVTPCALAPQCTPTPGPKALTPHTHTLCHTTLHRSRATTHLGVNRSAHHAPWDAQLTAHVQAREGVEAAVEATLNHHLAAVPQALAGGGVQECGVGPLLCKHQGERLTG